jgi:hypothetical protein
LSILPQDSAHGGRHGATSAGTGSTQCHTRVFRNDHDADSARSDVLLEVLGQLVQGLVEAHGCDDTRATLTPTPGECCVTYVQSDDLDSGS